MRVRRLGLACGGLGVAHSTCAVSKVCLILHKRDHELWRRCQSEFVFALGGFKVFPHGSIRRG